MGTLLPTTAPLDCGALLANPLPKVLVVDDEPSICNFARQVLEPITKRVEVASDAPRAMEAIESGDFDIIVSDIWMPGASGLELLAMAQQSQWDVAVILITGQAQVEVIIDALRLQAADFLPKPFTLQDLTEVVTRAYERLRRQREAWAYRSSLEASIQRRTRDLQTALREVETNYQMTLEALVAALDAREHETFAHSFRVRDFTTHLARLLGYPPVQMGVLEQGAMLHDIGKIAVSDAILCKPAKLTPEEWVEMRKHVTAGEGFLKRIPFLEGPAIIVRHHHERFDGTGYPDGLKGDQIPLGARVFAFADTLDAMTSDRFYRKALGYEAARKEVERCSGQQFDPRIVGLFLQVPDVTWMAIRAGAEKYAASQPR